MPLHRWLILLCLAVPAAMWSQVWEVSRLAAIPTTLGAAAVLVGIWWAKRQHYVRFVEHSRMLPSGNGLSENTTTGESASKGPESSPLLPLHKVGLYATGFFEVSGMRRYWVEAPAQYTTFETREHCVMTRIPRSRFLLFGQSSQEEVGWWYTFFQPGAIRNVLSGCLHFGLRPRPALQLEIDAADESEGKTLYLSFEDEATRSLVLADLQLDADPG